jgi:hypothetical protein
MYVRTLLAIFLLTGIALAQGSLPPKDRTTIYGGAGDSPGKCRKILRQPLSGQAVEVNPYIDYRTLYILGT